METPFVSVERAQPRHTNICTVFLQHLTQYAVSFFILTFKNLITAKELIHGVF